MQIMLECGANQVVPACRLLQYLESPAMQQPAVCGYRQPAQRRTAAIEPGKSHERVSQHQPGAVPVATIGVDRNGRSVVLQQGAPQTLIRETEAMHYQRSHPPWLQRVQMSGERGGKYG